MSIVDGILKAATYGATGGTMQQERALNAQILAANQRKLDAQTDQELGSRIMQSDVYQYLDFNDAKDPSKPLLSFKAAEALKQNPKIVIDILNTLPKNITQYYDESGALQQGRIAGVTEFVDKDGKGTGKYSIEIERADGKKTRGGRNPPMTRGASSDDKDEVVVLSADQLNAMLTERMQTLSANGGFSGGATLQRKMAEIHGAQAAAEIADRARVSDTLMKFIESGEAAPEVARATLEAYEAASALGPEAEYEFLTDTLGLDLDAIFGGADQGETPADPAAQGATDTKPGLFESMQNFSTDLHGKVFGSKSDDLQAVGNNLGKLATDASVGLHRAIFGSASDSIRTDEPPAPPAPPAPVTAPTPGSKDALANVQRRINGTENDPQRTDYSYESFRQRAGLPVPGDTQKSSISPDIDAAPAPVKQAILGEDMTPEARKAAILKAIEDGFAAPTQKQVEFTRDYMLKNGYTSPEKLASAPPQEVMNIAFTMASLMGPETTMDQRMAVAQSVMNFAQFGDSTMSSKDAQALQLKRQELQIEGSKELRAVAEAQKKPIEDLTKEYNDAFGPAMELLGKVTAAVGKDDRGFRTGKFAREGTDAFQQLYSSWRLAPEGSGAKIAYERALAEALPEVLANHIINEPRANLGEWFTGPITDLVARAKSRELKLDFGDFRVETSKDGKVKNLFLVTANGPDAERGQINARQFNAYFGDGMAEFIISTIEKTEQLKQAQ